MDIEGSGPLLNKPLANFNQSLSLLKLAADKKRKRVGIRLDGVKLRFVICTSISQIVTDQLEMQMYCEF